METLGIDHKGSVEYRLQIPFIKVGSPCKATTAFDHRGGWGHTPSQQSALKPFITLEKMEYTFKKTKEGLAEY